jgi:hypothetical protein
MIYIGDVVADSVYQMCYDMYETITGGARTAYPSGEPEFTPGFSGVRVTRS